MPHNLRLPPKLKTLWKVKIQDRETLYEEPHITIWRKDTKWRYSLRKLCFLDGQPDPAGVPDEILKLIAENHQELCLAWDVRFPTNPVTGEDDDD